jgi:hypothetical protein
MTGAKILRAAVIGADMTEDELLAGITEALTFGGWRWTHILRSDGVTMGDPGIPDIMAGHFHRGFVLAWELKSASGVVSPDQGAWLMALRNPHVDARVIRPADYDAALEVILNGRHPLETFDG